MWFLDLTNLTALPLAPGAPEFVNIPLCRGAHWMEWTMTRLLSFMGQRSNLPVNSCIGKVAGHDFFFLCQVRSPPLGLILFVVSVWGQWKSLWISHMSSTVFAIPLSFAPLQNLRRRPYPRVIRAKHREVSTVIVAKRWSAISSAERRYGRMKTNSLCSGRRKLLVTSESCLLCEAASSSASLPDALRSEEAKAKHQEGSGYR